MRCSTLCINFDSICCRNIVHDSNVNTNLRPKNANWCNFIPITIVEFISQLEELEVFKNFWRFVGRKKIKCIWVISHQRFLALIFFPPIFAKLSTKTSATSHQQLNITSRQHMAQRVAFKSIEIVTARRSRSLCQTIFEEITREPPWKNEQRNQKQLKSCQIG